MKRRKFGFEFQVTSITLLLLLMTTVVGVNTYNSYSKIIRDLQTSTWDNVELIYARTTLDNIYKAGINVKSYTITKDSFYLNKYENFREEIFYQLGQIDSIEFQKEHEPIIDSIITLSYLKVEQMDSLLNILVSQRISNALDTAYEKIKLDAKWDEAPVEVQKKWKLFKKKKKKEEQTDDQNKGVSIEEIEKNLSEVKENEAQLNETLIKHELDLINYGNVLEEHLSDQITKLEGLESERLAAISSAAKSDIESLNKQILFFCIVLVAFLLVLIFNILNYAKNNERFKKALKKAKREAEKLAKTKELFLANVSHEIRTPMNAISGFVDQIAKGPLTDEQRDQIEMVQKSTSHLLHLINDVLDISKLQRGKVQLEDLSFNVHQMLGDIIAFARPMAEEKNNDLVCDIKSNVPLVLSGDVHRLQQIILNLLSNAIKFTKDGEIKMEVFPIIMEGQNIKLKIVVSDTGIGMTPEQAKRVFMEFEQAEASTTRNYGGTGLGLAITKRLISLFEGTIDVDSELDKGTKVTIILPFKLGRIEQIVDIRTEKELETTFLEGKKILIVDDEPFNRKLLQSMLNDKKVVTTEASNGKDAVQLVKSENFDVVLMDVRMPELNGIEATKRIRKIKDHTKKDVLIIALTAAVTDEDKHNYFHSGMNGFVPKPFKEEQLIAALYQAFQGQEEEKPEVIMNDEKDGLEVINTMETTVSFGELKKLSGNDNEFYKDMLNTFVQGAEEALEKIDKDYANKDLPRIPDHAHKISAPARHLGADKLYKVLKLIEKEGRKDDFERYDVLIDLCNKEMRKVIELVKRECEEIA